VSDVDAVDGRGVEGQVDGLASRFSTA
jgi:hypothetical protein